MRRTGSGGADILLVRPNSGIPIHTPPLGLGYVASDLIRNGMRPVIKDCLLDNSSVENVTAIVRRERIKIVGISCCTDELPWARELVGSVKRSSDAAVILGGAHPSCVKEYIFSEVREADFSVYAEAEGTVSRLAAAILDGDSGPGRLGEIPNLMWKNGPEVVVNRRSFIENLDEIDFPAWEMMPPLEYSRRLPHGFLHRKKPFAQMITTRGCPHRCRFCSTSLVHGTALRKRSPGNIIAEIRYLKSRFGVREIFFEDDNFTLDRAFAMEVCGRIASLGSGICFSLPNGISAETVSAEMLDALKAANFYSFAVGIESGSPRILRRMGKKNDLAKIKSAVLMAKKRGFFVTGFFILGFPGETRSDIEATIDYAKSAGVDKACFTKYLPLPGTETYNELVEKNAVTRGEYFGALGNSDIPFAPEGVSRGELKSYLRKAAFSFYMRPSVILGHARRLGMRDLLRLPAVIKRFS